jgi:hypothetical protein
MKFNCFGTNLQCKFADIAIGVAREKQVSKEDKLTLFVYCGYSGKKMVLTLWKQSAQEIQFSFVYYEQRFVTNLTRVQRHGQVLISI